MEVNVHESNFSRPEMVGKVVMHAHIYQDGRKGILFVYHDEPNHQTRVSVNGLTEEDLHRVMKSWSKLTRDLEQHGS